LSGDRASSARGLRGNDWCWGTDLQIPAGGIPFLVVQLPSPLNQVGARSTALWDLEATSAGSMLRTLLAERTVLVRQFSNRHLHQLGLVGVLVGGGWGHVDENTTIAFAGHRMVLGWPTNTESITRQDLPGHVSEAASISL